MMWSRCENIFIDFLEWSWVNPQLSQEASIFKKREDDDVITPISPTARECSLGSIIWPGHKMPVIKAFAFTHKERKKSGCDIEGVEILPDASRSIPRNQLDALFKGKQRLMHRYQNSKKNWFWSPIWTLHWFSKLIIWLEQN